MALCTATAVRPDMFIKIFLAVIIRELLARFDGTDRIDENMTAFYLRLAIGLTRMIDIPRDVLARRAVNRPPAIHFKKIFASATVFLGGGYRAAEIFDDALALLIRARGEEAEPGARPPYPNSLGVCWFLRFHNVILDISCLPSLRQIKGKHLKRR